MAEVSVSLSPGLGGAHLGEYGFHRPGRFDVEDLVPGAEYLLEAGVALVGIDSLNIDDTGDLSRPVHSLLLASEVPIVEHLRGLAELPNAGFRFFAVPVKVKGMGTFPVRAFGIVEETA